ncbi:YceI family protein [Candidatus Peribacteria bacterium]|nr:MAG: YceI family protein [Candidatus Peribacteria bacterium]
MRQLSIPVLALSLVTLAACQTSSLTEDEKATVVETETAFSGELREIDAAQSVISFTGKSNIINHEGKFPNYTAQVTLDADEPSNLEKAQISAEIDVATVEVDAAGLQGHFMKDDFFAVETYPKATFVSTDIVSKGDNMYAVTGDLTIKGTTKSVTIDAEITDDYLTATYDLPRLDFGIGNEAYGQKLLEPMVPVSIKLVFKK